MKDFHKLWRYNEVQCRITVTEIQKAIKQNCLSWLSENQPVVFAIQPFVFINLNEFWTREKHTNNLYWFTLVPKATSNPQKPLGIYYAIKIQITNAPSKKWPWTPQVTHFLWHTITIEIRTPSDSALTQQYSEIQEIQKGLHLMEIKSKDYNNPIPLLWENPKAWMKILKTQICFPTFTNV